MCVVLSLFCFDVSFTAFVTLLTTGIDICPTLQHPDKDSSGSVLLLILCSQSESRGGARRERLRRCSKNGNGTYLPV